LVVLNPVDSHVPLSEFEVLAIRHICDKVGNLVRNRHHHPHPPHVKVVEKICKHCVSYPHIVQAPLPTHLTQLGIRGCFCARYHHPAVMTKPLVSSAMFDTVSANIKAINTSLQKLVADDVESGTLQEFEQELGGKRTAMIMKKVKKGEEDYGGKSGAFVFIGKNNPTLIAKEITRAEIKVLRSIMDSYLARIMDKEPPSLLPRFYKIVEHQKKAFVIMNNVDTLVEVEEEQKNTKFRFDLKGSRRNREVDDCKAGKTCKDNNFGDSQLIFNNTKKLDDFHKGLEKDTQFLASNNIMDYSLLLIVMKPTKTASSGGGILLKGIGPTEPTPVAATWGIIDILQPFSTQKRLESVLKRQGYDKDKISSIKPTRYKKRFLEYMKRTFVGGKPPHTPPSLLV